MNKIKWNPTTKSFSEYQNEFSGEETRTYPEMATDDMDKVLEDIYWDAENKIENFVHRRDNQIKNEDLFKETKKLWSRLKSIGDGLMSQWGKKYGL